MTNNPGYLKQGDEVTAADLREKWAQILSFYDQMIAGGHQLRPIRFLVRHIIEKGYHNYFFPGTSLYNLLVSIPMNNKVDYTKTLKIQVDQLRSLVRFDYRDLTGLNRDDETDFENSLKWSDSCQLTESVATFEYFISTNEDWKATTN